MQQISRAKHIGDLTYLLQNNYANVYAKLQQILPPQYANLFARIQQNNSGSIWFSPYAGNYTTFAAANNEIKDQAADILREAKDSVHSYLQKDDELAGITSYIFNIPSDENILIYQSEEGLKVVLDQWACNNLRNDRANNPIGRLVNRPKPDHTLVNLSIKYSDGTIAKQASFVYNYKSIIQNKRTDANGKHSLGLLKNGSTFSIGQEDGSYKFDLSVNEGQTEYEVELPYLVNAIVKVQNQLKELMKNYPLNIINPSGIEKVLTNENGERIVSNIVLGKGPLTIVDGKNEKNKQEFELKKEDNEFLFTINALVERAVTIRVIDDKGEIVANHPIQFEFNSKKNKLNSSTEGIVPVAGVQHDHTLKIIDGLNVHNNTEVKIEEENQEIVFQVERLKPAIVSIKLIDHKNNPIPKNAMDVTINKVTHNTQTNENGIVSFAKERFIDKENVAVQVHTKTKKDKKKIINKKFKFDKEKDEYVIKLKKFNWLWLLLLLLPLLLLLLIKCHKDVAVQAYFEGTENPIENANVVFKYEQSYIYNEGSFFVNNEFTDTLQTDSSGIAVFENLEYTVYSCIFKHFSKAWVMASNSCYSSDTLTPAFHRIGKKETLILQMYPRIGPLDFKVVDAEDKEPLPDAMVWVEAEINEKLYTDTAQTNPAGIVTFNGLPLCGNIIMVKSEYDGYFPDSIINLPVDSLIGGIDDTRLLELEPIKERIIFFVTDCETDEPVPGATAKITLTNNLKSKVQNAKTNVNGIGKGTYDDAHIISELEIEVSKKYYKNGQLDSVYRIEDFIKLPDSLRTICLEPEENNMEFLNVDSITREPLAGVMNIVSVDKNGATSKDTVYSNANGAFTVGGVKVSNTISIQSYLEPNYNPNLTKIQDDDVIALIEGTQDDRTIPLSPKVFGLVFRTVDATLVSLVPNASLNVYVDGNYVSSPSNSGNGEFTVNVFHNSVVSIVASKSGYITNDTKIKNKAFSFLKTANQSERDIPLLVPPCSTDSICDEANQQVKRFDLGKENSTFLFEYYNDSQVDTIGVYCDDGRLLFEVNYATNTMSFQHSKSISAPCRFIYVKVKGQTNWCVRVNCPN